MPLHRRPILVIDLAFGDCGKGTIVDFLTRRCQPTAVVRFNGGPQAGHNVVTPDGRHHTFSQFGSGSFIPNVKTVLSRFMLVEPYALLNEARHLESIHVNNPLSRLIIDRNCLVITPCHQAANRLRELARAEAPHGSCGLGVGEAVQDSLDYPHYTLRAHTLADRHAVKERLRTIRDLKIAQIGGTVRNLANHPRARESISVLLDDSWMDVAVDVYHEIASRATIADESTIARLLRSGQIIFEGAQGVLLDESFGFHPHTTWSNTTFANAEILLREAQIQEPPVKIGVLRAYFTRHGPGPFVTEDPSLSPRLPEPHNDASGWQGPFRLGPFDALAAQYALSVSGPIDALAITHMDQLHLIQRQICTAYQEPSGNRMRVLPLEPANNLNARETLTRRLMKCTPVYEPADRSPQTFANRVEELLEVKVGITSSGPTADGKTVTDTSFPT